MLFAVCTCILAVLSGTLAGPVFEQNLAAELQASLTRGVSPEHVFRDFKIVFNKTYVDATEEATRRGIFIANAKFTVEHNLLFDKGETSFTVAVNQFADMTQQEFLAFYTGLAPLRNSGNGSHFLAPANLQIPDTVDWRDKGLVTAVKNQQSCGSCWSFSTTGSMEGQLARKTQKLVPLSEQQLVDCSTKNHGCNGGLMDVAFDYIKTAGGLMSEQDYPYKGTKSLTCKSTKGKLVPGTAVKGYTDITGGNEAGLKQAVATVGPVSVAIDASQRSFMMYKSGIYYAALCSSTKLNHAVLAVGYGSGAGDYWLVKNSWGTTWGDGGYVKMARNKNNNCGIATMASYPLL